jgi:hypothetical protein
VILLGVTTTHLPARSTITSNAKNVIDASRRTSVAKLLFIGSSGIYTRAVRKRARLLAVRKTIQRRGKFVNITHFDMLVCRKACIAAENMNIGRSGADK